MANVPSGGTLFRDIFEASRDAILVHEVETSEVIEAYGGTVSAGASPEGGAAFEIDLPAARSPDDWE